MFPYNFSNMAWHFSHKTAAHAMPNTPQGCKAAATMARQTRTVMGDVEVQQLFLSAWQRRLHR